MNELGNKFEIVVSVVITTFNRGSMVCQAIDCVLEQKCNFPIEIIVGDDGSTDNTRELLLLYKDKYPDLITIIFREKNLGVAGNWASCVKKAKGKYIATCDDDDFWHNNLKLSIQVEYMDLHPETSMLHTDKNNLFVETNVLYENVFARKNLIIPEGDIQQQIYSGKVPICFSTNVFRSSVIFEHINLDDFVNKNFGLQDWPIWVLIANYGRIDYLPISTCTYRVGNESIINQKNYEKQFTKLERDRCIVEYLCSCFPDRFEYNKTDFDKYEFSVMLSLAIKKNDHSKAKVYAQKLFDLNVRSLKVFSSKYILTFYIVSSFLKIKRLVFNERNI